MTLRLNRRVVMAGAATTLLSRAAHGAPFTWDTADPAVEGFAPDIAARLDNRISEKRIWGIDGVIVMRRRQVVLERYFEGAENSWGKRNDHVSYGPDRLHNLYSITKSIVALLYGIALAEGKVPPPEAPLCAQFPAYADLVAEDPRRAQQTIAHALTMTLGTEWDESGPYNDERNAEIAMEMAKDRYRFVLSRPVVQPPGKRFNYNGGATALLGKIVANGTGRPLHEYARAALFDPLGLGPTEWINSKDTWVAAKQGYADGEAVAASGLRMTPRDLARIGQMMLDGGKAGERQVVPADWVRECVTPRFSVDELRRYGYQWYIGDFEYGTRQHPHLDRWIGCFGNGGQRLWVMPDLDLVVVITAGNYGPDNQWIPPVRIMREVVLAGLL